MAKRKGKNKMRTQVKRKGATRNRLAARKTTATKTSGNNSPTKSPKTAKDVIDFIKKNNIKIVDLKFCDLPGLWQHFSMPAEEAFDPGLWTEGIGFDGSSIRGFKKIEESDMILRLDPTTVIVDPACEIPTASILCNIFDPETLEPYTRDPRYVAQKAADYLRESKVADTSYWGPEAEFYIFNDIRFDQTAHSGYYFVDSKEGIWNSGAEENPNLGYKPRHKEGYFPVPPTDSIQDLRSEIVLTMKAAGIPVEVHHHEVGTAGQCEIDMRYGPLVNTCDNLLLYKYIIKNVAKKHNMTATFMPKPLFEDNGSGMHVHQSLWKDGKNIFYDKNGYALLSQEAKWYIGGLLKHASSLLAFCAPTTSSYKRLVPGYEAPINLVYSKRNRSACVRIPVYNTSEKGKRIEFRSPDPSCNPYLAIAAMLMAGIDGIKNKIDPGQPLEKNLYDLSDKDKQKIKTVPGSLDEALDALEKDQKFLLQGNVFTQDLIDTWISYKRENEIDPLRLRPHPYEFFLYYDI